MAKYGKISARSTSNNDEALNTALNELPLEYYQTIYKFCAVRNSFTAYEQKSQSERVEFITGLLKSLNIEFEIDAFRVVKNKSLVLEEQEYLVFYNIIMRGSSERILIAHHDVFNLDIENANDNSASVINAIAAKRLRPELNVVLTDGEEPPCMGIGAHRLSRQIKDGLFGKIEWVLNLELTGIGGTNFLVGNYQGNLTDHIVKLFNCPRVNVPPNDAAIIQKYGIDTTVINPLPLLEDGLVGRYDCLLKGGGYLDYGVIYRCHTNDDNLSHIKPEDMKSFVENVVLKIIDS